MHSTVIAPPDIASPQVARGPSNLVDLRREIDGVDAALLDALARRQELVRAIAAVKNAAALPLQDPRREEALLAERVLQARARGVSPFVVTRVFQEVLDDALRLQQAVALGAGRAPTDARVGVLATHEVTGAGLAARRFFAHERPDAALVTFPTLSALVQGVLDGQVTFAVVACEDALTGAIGEVYDQLLSQPLAVVGEELLEVEREQPGVAGARPAPALTRFMVLAAHAREVDARVPARTALALVPQASASLLGALDALRAHGLELSRLESRPRPGRTFAYAFYLEVHGSLADLGLQAALEALAPCVAYLRALGSFPSRERGRTAPPPRAILDAATPASAPARAPSGPKLDDQAKLARRTSAEQATTIIDVGRGVRFGADPLVMIAGPCAVESREQVMACARAVKEAGGRVLRGGCFKPRTSPYSFQGLGLEGLALLAGAGREFDLPIVTEVLTPEDVVAVAEHADILQVGARNMQNFRLLQAVGRAHRPVILKRGMSARLDELLHAAEYVLSEGNRQVILCERGIRTFETATRSTLDLAAVPLLQRLTHLPIIVDPSHAAGARELVIPLALAAAGVRPHGLMVELHPEPEKALSDGPQALRFAEFELLMGRLREREVAC